MSLSSMGRVGGKRAARLTVVAPEISSALKTGDSVAINGACQTVVHNNGTSFSVECLGETLEKSNLGFLRPGQGVNLERALCLGSRLDGHLVQGHVSEMGEITCLETMGNNRYLRIALSKAGAMLCIPEGSVAVDGISLTISSIQENEIALNVIPHTWQATALRELRVGAKVNIETDMIGRYIARLGGFIHESGSSRGSENTTHKGTGLYDLLSKGVEYA